MAGTVEDIKKNKNKAFAPKAALFASEDNFTMPSRTEYMPVFFSHAAVVQLLSGSQT